MSILTFNISFAPIFNLSNFDKLPLLFTFDSEQLKLISVGMNFYVELFHQPLLCEVQ